MFVRLHLPVIGMINFLQHIHKVCSVVNKRNKIGTHRSWEINILSVCYLTLLEPCGQLQKCDSVIFGNISTLYSMIYGRGTSANYNSAGYSDEVFRRLMIANEYFQQFGPRLCVPCVSYGTCPPYWHCSHLQQTVNPSYRNTIEQGQSWKMENRIDNPEPSNSAKPQGFIGQNSDILDAGTSASSGYHIEKKSSRCLCWWNDFLEALSLPPPSCSTNPTKYKKFIEAMTDITHSDSVSEAGQSRKKLKRESRGKQQLPFTKTEYTAYGSLLKEEGNMVSNSQQVVLDVLSYNLLSQTLLESHKYLYIGHDPRALLWETRRDLLFNHLSTVNADVLCLQEMEEKYVSYFDKTLVRLGYEGIFKKRTGDQVDGCSIYYKKDLFILKDWTSVEYYQPAASRLDRHNIGLVMKLCLRDNPQQCFVVATTHLLFNPRRNDVKLAQMQLLLAEVERFAFQRYNRKTAQCVYWPLIITGDLNQGPNTGINEFLVSGTIDYANISGTIYKMNPDTKQYERESQPLIPKKLLVSDTCQHWLLEKNRRELNRPVDHKEELLWLGIANMDHEQKLYKTLYASLQEQHTLSPQDKVIADRLRNGLDSSLVELPNDKFGTGVLQHPFALLSVYDAMSEDVVTTYHEQWVFVDYMYYSGMFSESGEKFEADLRLLSRAKLPSLREAEICGRIPNKYSPSDHYPLLASFLLQVHSDSPEDT